MGDKLKRIWKEAVMAYLRYYPGVPPEIQTENLPITSLRTSHLNLLVQVFRVCSLIFRIIILTKFLYLTNYVLLFDIKVTFKVDRHRSLKSVHDRITLSLSCFINMLLTSKGKIIVLSS